MQPRSTDQPVPGFYSVRLRRGAAPCVAEIRWEQPLDPVTGETLDRSYRYTVRINGVFFYDDATLWKVHDYGRPISRVVHDNHIDRARWALRYDPENPICNPLRRADVADVQIRL